MIDIPEPDLTTSVTCMDFTPSEPVDSTDAGTSEVSTEPVRLRRSNRERRPPLKFTYDELGKPVVLGTSYFFPVLGVSFPKAALSPLQCSRWLMMHDGTHDG